MVKQKNIYMVQKYTLTPNQLLVTARIKGAGVIKSTDATSDLPQKCRFEIIKIAVCHIPLHASPLVLHCAITAGF